MGLASLILGCVAASLGVIAPVIVIPKAKIEPLTICDGCPTFAPVPTPPKPLRSIRFVAQHELTWNNYLKAFDENACDLPTASSPIYKYKQRDILERLSLYRLDWPIAILGPAEVECYLAWLQKKVKYRVALPTASHGVTTLTIQRKRLGGTRVIQQFFIPIRSMKVADLRLNI
jgi:hypothetical protein